MPDSVRKQCEQRTETRTDQRVRDRKNSRNDIDKGMVSPARLRKPADIGRAREGKVLDAGRAREGRVSPGETFGKEAIAEDRSDRRSPGGRAERRGVKSTRSEADDEDRGAQHSQKKGPRPQSVGVGGDDDGEKCGRQMFDKNTLRTQSREMFISAIQQYRQGRCKSQSRTVNTTPPQGSALQVFLRKRPIFEKEEQQRADYDVTSTLPGQPMSTQMVIHNCLFQADLKTPFINHLTFDFDCVFDEAMSNADVYDQAAAQLVRSSLDGGVGTMFMFGQTGSGKTHTMGGIQELAARDLFQGSKDFAFDASEGGIEAGASLSVQFVELRGNRTFDLLAPGEGPRGNLRPELRLRERSDGSYAAEGAVELFPSSPGELLSAMETAQSRRATSATGSNDVSSRSHAICTLRLLHSGGQLMLVDCAGTERRKDSMYHTRERQQEGAEINASLHALKECIRHLTSTQRVPSYAYRASALTKILADAFIRGARAQLAVVCTASPCATDTEHTIATLRMGMALGGRGGEHEEKQSLVDIMPRKERLQHPKQWASEQVFEWLSTANAGQFRDLAAALPSNFTGQMLVRLTEGRCVQLCSGVGGSAAVGIASANGAGAGEGQCSGTPAQVKADAQRRGRQFFDALHQEIHRAELSRKG